MSVADIVEAGLHLYKLSIGSILVSVADTVEAG